ncbi:MAG: hypothetical protein II007_06680 [Gammaproteobacteria bacterium]|nr:hypothetical protein [Gammaproteobacteria bacterium]
MVRMVGVLLLMLASAVALASPAVPTRLPGIGSPVAEGNAREVLRRYCQPIENWNLMAWQMCVDSGLLVNRAIRDYHQRGCASRAAPGCAELQQLYAGNYRLWDGSVDNVGRAQRMGGGSRSKGTAARTSPQLATRRCEQSAAAAEAAVAALEARAKAFDETAVSDDVEMLLNAIDRVSGEQQALESLWPAVPRGCTASIARIADRYQAVKRDYGWMLGSAAELLRQRLQVERQKASCLASQQRMLAVSRRLERELQWDRHMLMASWRRGHPLPWRWPEIQPSPGRPKGACEQTALAAPVAEALAQLQEAQQLGQREQQLSRMLLAGNAHYPQRLQSRRWGLVASIAVIGLLVALAALWRYRRN